ncbi:condensation domain-containing protein [Aspergillus insuetus]
MDDLDGALAHDRQSPPILGGSLHRISVVESKSGPRYLIWAMNHAAYDGWSLGRILETVERFYQEPAFQPNYQLTYGSFIHHVARLRAHDTCQTIANSLGFWKSYLSGIEQAPLLFNYPQVWDPRQDRLAVFHNLTIPSPINKELTVPSVIVASWILLLHQLSDRSDITIAHLVTGRTVPLPGIETCPGPTISKVPLRIRLPELLPKARLSTVAELVRAEAIRVMPHEQSGLDAIRDHVPLQQHAGAILGRLSLDLTVHLAGHLDFSAGKALGMELMDLRSTSAARWVLCGVFPEPRRRSGSFNVAVIWDARAASDEQINALVEKFKDILSDRE